VSLKFIDPNWWATYGFSAVTDPELDAKWTGAWKLQKYEADPWPAIPDAEMAAISRRGT
jgi:hypothetical protein